MKTINLPELVFPQLMLADVCGQLGRIHQGRAAIEAVYALAPAFANRRSGLVLAASPTIIPASFTLAVARQMS